MASFDLRGSTINALAQPYRFYLLQRVHLTITGVIHNRRLLALNGSNSSGAKRAYRRQPHWLSQAPRLG
jgi:hypothetical protein